MTTETFTVGSDSGGAGIPQGGPATAALDMDGFKIRALGDPSLDSDATPRSYVDNQIIGQRPIALVQLAHGVLFAQAMAAIDPASSTYLAAGSLGGVAVPSAPGEDVLAGITFIVPPFEVFQDLNVVVSMQVSDATGANTARLNAASLGAIPPGAYAGGDWPINFADHAPTIVGTDLSVATTHLKSAAGTPYTFTVSYYIGID